MSSKKLSSQPSDLRVQRLTGVVIWAEPRRELAVIWCTDHGRLAYLASRADLREGDFWPEQGDLVGFAMERPGGLRRCSDLHIIQKNWHPELATALREASKSRVHDSDGADGGDATASPAKHPNLRII